MLIDFELLTKTLVVLFLAVMSPGPDFVMVLRNSLRYGRGAGLASALGVACGCLLSFTLVVLGLKVLFSYHLIKVAFSLICGAYLIYIGFLSIRNKTQHQQLASQQRQTGVQRWFYFKNGLLTNLFNPKLYTLSAAILTYTEQQHPSLATNIAIVVGQGIMALLWFAAVSIVFSYSRVQSAYLHKERLINILVGVIFIALGIRIMLG